jgi:glutathione S-transferase
MLTLYYSPGACSMASHIGLEESGAQFEPRLVRVAKGEHLTPEYRRINPRAKVPALQFDDGSVLVENTAILTWVARTHPDQNLMPKDALGEARCISLCTWLSNTVHPAFGRWLRPERVVEDEACRPAVKDAGKKAFWAGLQEIDGMLDGKTWLVGGQYTVCDPYALVFYSWAPRLDLPVRELKNYTALKDRLLQRPAVRAVLQREESTLLATA